jgi:hypothetical protein
MGLPIFASRLLIQPCHDLRNDIAASRLYRTPRVKVREVTVPVIGSGARTGFMLRISRWAMMLLYRGL